MVPVPLAQLSNLNVSGFEHIVVQDNSCLSECAPTVPCKKIEATEEWAVASTQTGQLGKAVPLVDGSVMVASRNSVFQVTAEGGLIVRAPLGGRRRFQLGETGEFSYYRSTTVEHFGDSGGFLGSHLYDGFALSRFVPQSNSLIILEARVEHHEPSLDSFRVVSAAGTSATYETEGMLNSAVTVAGLVYSTDTQLVSRGLDGAELWRTDAPLRETKASKNGNSLMGVRRGPGSHIVHIDQSTGALAGEHSLPTPVWAFGFSPSGDYSYAATKTHVYVYLDGTLLRTHQVPHEPLTTADVSDTGAIVVGGKSAGVTQIYLADALADTPWKGTGTADAQAYRPYVRFRPGSLEFVSIEHGSLDSYTVQKN